MPYYIEIPLEPTECPLCFRPLVKETNSFHHWIPVSKKGTEGSIIHQICHDMIHRRFSESELARTYNTPWALRTDEKIQSFIEWVQTKPPSYKGAVKPAKERYP